MQSTQWALTNRCTWRWEVSNNNKGKINEQQHFKLFSLLGNETEMLVTWSTLWPLQDDAYVLYGLEEKRLNQSSKAEVSLYGKISLYTYRALLTGLTPLTKYCE